MVSVGFGGKSVANAGLSAIFEQFVPALSLGLATIPSRGPRRQTNTDTEAACASERPSTATKDGGGMAEHRKGGVISRSARQEPAVQWLSVLVVDDEPPVREFLTRWLVAWGYDVKTAASASEALEVMQAGPIPIMMCDIKMPGHDGLWLAEQVRARWPKTAIIIATGAHAHDLEAVYASRKLGAVDYILKPFEREMVRQALHRAADALQAETPQGEHSRSSP